MSLLLAFNFQVELLDVVLQISGGLRFSIVSKVDIQLTAIIVDRRRRIADAYY